MAGRLAYLLRPGSPALDLVYVLGGAALGWSVYRSLGGAWAAAWLAYSAVEALFFLYGRWRCGAGGCSSGGARSLPRASGPALKFCRRRRAAALARKPPRLQLRPRSPCRPALSPALTQPVSP